MPKRRRIAVLDPSSRTLPYDYWYIRDIASTVDVDLYCSIVRENGDYLSWMRRVPGVTVVDLPIIWPGRLGRLINYFAMWLFVLLNRRKYAVINLQWAVLPRLDRWLAWPIRRKFVFTMHNPVPHGYAGYRYEPYAQLAAVANRVIAVSEHSCAEIRQRYGIANERVSLIRHGVMPLHPRFEKPGDEGLRAPCAHPDASHLAFWGKVEPYKGVDFFEHLIADPRAADTEISIWGRWAPSLQGLRAKLKRRCDVRDGYLLTGAVKRLFDSGAIFVLPYKKASQSGVFYTLLFHEQPFVCTDCGDLGAFVRGAGHVGLLFDRHDLDSFYAAVSYLEHNWPCVRDDFRRVVRDKYMWKGAEVLLS